MVLGYGSPIRVPMCQTQLECPTYDHLALKVPGFLYIEAI